MLATHPAYRRRVNPEGGLAPHEEATEEACDPELPRGYAAACLARLFDPGAKRYHANQRDVASLPALLRLLRQKRCRNVLADRAREWNPDMPANFGKRNAATCEREIDAALAAYAVLEAHRERRIAVASLKEFRDKVLAHSLLDVVLKFQAHYQQLYYLVVVAREVTIHAKFAIDGKHRDLRDAQRERRRQADAFWQPALSAVFVPGRA